MLLYSKKFLIFISILVTNRDRIVKLNVSPRKQHHELSWGTSTVCNVRNIPIIHKLWTIRMSHASVQGNFLYVGLRVNWCFCGMSYGSYGTSTACNVKCPGNSTTICGGINANSVIALGGLHTVISFLFCTENIGFQHIISCIYTTQLNLLAQFYIFAIISGDIW